jgi:hypothetical protein
MASFGHHDHIFEEFLLLLSSSATWIPDQKIIAPTMPQQGVSRLDSSRTTGSSSNMPPTEAPLQCRNHLVHSNNTNSATNNVTKGTHSNLIWIGESTKNEVQHHQQKISSPGRNGSVGEDTLCQCGQRHPGGRILRTRAQYHASRCISPFNRCFTDSSRSAGLLF